MKHDSRPRRFGVSDDCQNYQRETQEESCVLCALKNCYSDTTGDGNSTAHPSLDRWDSKSYLKWDIKSNHGVRPNSHCARTLRTCNSETNIAKQSDVANNREVAAFANSTREKQIGERLVNGFRERNAGDATDLSEIDDSALRYLAVCSRVTSIGGPPNRKRERTAARTNWSVSSLELRIEIEKKFEAVLDQRRYGCCA